MPGNDGDRGLVVYLMRRDLRTVDNPVFRALVDNAGSYSHLLPLFVFPPDQVEIDGFNSWGAQSPYPKNDRWTCGAIRARFLAQSAGDVKLTLENIGSGLLMRVGSYEHVLRTVFRHYTGDRLPKVGALWMTADSSPEEIQHEAEIAATCREFGVEFKLFPDAKHLYEE